MVSRSGAILRAIGSFLVALAIGLGMPLLLVVAVGSPFPSSIPSVDEIRVTLSQNGDGFSDFVLSSLAVLMWVVWLQLVASLVFEIVAVVRCREAPRLPTAPGIQSFAARLVASMALATTLTTAPLLAPALGTLDLGPAKPADAATSAEVSAVVPMNTSVAVETRSIVVTESVELWDLAEAAYGDGVSWKTIAEASAGDRDASGAVITAETDAVPAGTTVKLPVPVDVGALAAHGVVGGGGLEDLSPGRGEATPGLLEPNAEAGSTGTTTVAIRIVQPGDSMWSMAQAEVERRIGTDASDDEVAAYWAEVVRANDNLSSGDVNIIHPGERVLLPGALRPVAPIADGPVELATGPHLATQTALSEGGAVPELVLDAPAGRDDLDDAAAAKPVQTAPPFEAAVEESDTPAEAAGGVTFGPVSGTVDAEPEAQGSSGASPVLPVAMATFGAALLSAGVHGALRRRRSLQRRLRSPGTMAAPATAGAAAFDAALAHAATEMVDGRSDGYRAASAEVAQAVRAVGPMEIHAAPDGGLRALASSASAAPMVDLFDPPAPEALAAALERPTGWHPEPPLGTVVLPTAVVVGTDDEGIAVMLDLASAGRVRLEGDHAGVTRLALGIVLDLAVSDRADDLLVIGMSDSRVLADLERVRVVTSPAEALVEATRCGHAVDSDTPVIVVAVEPVPAVSDALVDLGAIVVAPDLDDAPASIRIEGDHAVLQPSGTRVQLAAPDRDGMRSVAELLALSGVTATAAPEPAPELTEAFGPPAELAPPIEPGPVEVRVLGPVEIVGAAPFSSVKAVDVVTYLAFHRNGVDADQIKSWVWPTFEPPTDKAFANVMSRARTALGVDEEGGPLLSRAGTERTYRLSDRVTTDFDRVRASIELAERAPERQRQIDLLVGALRLIRGVPFTGGTASSFAWADNHVRAHVEFTLDEAVHRCADLALEQGDLATARWAALKGLELVPGCEGCFRRRFLVAGAGNNRTELRRAMADLERTAAAELGEPEAFDLISTDLLELFGELDRALVLGTT